MKTLLKPAILLASLALVASACSKNSGGNDNSNDAMVINGVTYNGIQRNGACTQDTVDAHNAIVTTTVSSRSSNQEVEAALQTIHNNCVKLQILIGSNSCKAINNATNVQMDINYGDLSQHCQRVDQMLSAPSDDQSQWDPNQDQDTVPTVTPPHDRPDSGRPQPHQGTTDLSAKSVILVQVLKPEVWSALSHDLSKSNPNGEYKFISFGKVTAAGQSLPGVFSCSLLGGEHLKRGQTLRLSVLSAGTLFSAGSDDNNLAIYCANQTRKSGWTLEGLEDAFGDAANFSLETSKPQNPRGHK